MDETIATVVMYSVMGFMLLAVIAIMLRISPIQLAFWLVEKGQEHFQTAPKGGFGKFVRRIMGRGLGKRYTTVVFLSEAKTWELISTFPWDTRKDTSDKAKLHANYFTALYERPTAVRHRRCAVAEALPEHEERFPLLADTHLQLQNYLVYGPGQGRKKPSKRIPQPVHTYTEGQKHLFLAAEASGEKNLAPTFSAEALNVL